MSWLILFFAGVFEIVWATGLKATATSPRPWLYFLIAVAIPAIMYLLAVAMKEIPLGTAYAVWTGIGAVGAFLVGILYFAEPLTVPRSISVLLIVFGLIGLKLTSH